MALPAPDFSAISPHLDVRISDKARRLALRLDSTRRKVCLVIPKRASLKNAYLFALEHRDWIEQRILQIPQPIPLAHGTTLPLLGRDVTIHIDKQPTYRVTDIDLGETTLTVKTKLDDIEPRLMRYLKKLASEKLREIADQKAEHIGKRITNLSLRDMKTRWGSCSTDGRMALSWRLIFAPFVAYDYVVAHEVAHLIHPHHGPKFWKLCEELAVDFKTGHRWMKEHGTSLMRYGG